MSAGRSLRDQLLRWLLAPLLILWAVNVWYSYSRVIQQINAAYDRTLLGSALAIAEQTRVTAGEVSVDVPYAALQMLETGSQDRIYYQVARIGSEQAVSRYPHLSPPPPVPPAGQQ